MQGCGNDYIFFDNRKGTITSPGSLCVSLCDRHYGIGGYGIVLIEDSRVADARMRIFNRDGTEGAMAGNAIRCVGKYLYDKGIVKKEYMTIETAGGIKSLLLYTRNGKANTISVGMGKADLDAMSATHHPPRLHHHQPAGGDRRGHLSHHLRQRGQSPLRGVLRRSLRPGPGDLRAQV